MEEETADVLQGHVPGMLSPDAGFTGCSLCAEGEYNQGNCDGGLNPPQGLCCVFT